MRFHLPTALAGALVLGLGAAAHAQSTRPSHADLQAVSPYHGHLATGRSVYAAPAAASIEANQTVMGLRVPSAQVDPYGRR